VLGDDAGDFVAYLEVDDALERYAAISAGPLRPVRWRAKGTNRPAAPSPPAGFSRLIRPSP
jgi:hypothetical protein